MVNTIVNYLINIFGSINKNLVIFIISLFPILELRGGLLAAGLLKLPFISSFLICFIGNILPIPFILMFLEKIFIFLKKNQKIKNILDNLEKKSLSKSDQIQKYKYLGLFLFVAIPLPGSGAWTGALLAILLNLDKKKSFIAILLGVLGAGIIMSILSYGILTNLF